ncbi:zinc finger protein 26-like [Pomacea canaliculata]|uniref:zinc finger protein 26-like n=1 Tax=Pomacea canaliculata TaxID=400727 RepID=UPI000D7257BA|nr:zinc finger protein 26-like [Pomacea canaliculata]XP_025097776.1 zinc finger protein 26-like [Pomacea canaliculata]XP_025097777.1 zinc finger protein 26-like [Pomacea canaliculata]
MLEEEAMSAINNPVQVSCIHSIKTEPRSVADLQDLNDKVMLKTETTFCSDTNMTYSSSMNCVQLKNISGPTYIKPEFAKNIPQSNWKHEDDVKLELSSQDTIGCIKTEQVPGEELCPIKAEYTAHIEQSDCSHKNAVKVECHCQDVTCSIKTEQDFVQCAKTEEQLVSKQEEQDHAHMVKTETGWPGHHALWQNNIDGNCQEMSVGRCITPEVTDVVRENQHQTHATVTEVTIDSATGSRSDAEPYQCQVCLSSFSFSTLLMKHMKMHSDFEAYNCTPCSVVLERIDALKQHKETNRNKRSDHCDERPHQCTVCHVAFKRLSSLKKHMVTHSNLKPYQCTLCHEAFKRSGDLKIHMVSHSDVRPHQCSVCHVAFKTLRELKQHKVIHSDVKPFECSVCRKMFKRSYEVKKHMVTHSDERPYQCSVCRLAFKTPGTLRKHKMNHIEVRPHQCSFCHVAFKTPLGLKEHMMVNHTEVRPHQ